MIGISRMWTFEPFQLTSVSFIVVEISTGDCAGDRLGLALKIFGGWGVKNFLMLT
jgi:hypothetical protein